jgi:hypothetical protein
MKVYIAGKITGNKEAESQFESAESKMKFIGYDVFNTEKEFRNSHMTEDCIMLNRLNELNKCDALALLPNYNQSKCSKIEIAWANKFNIPIWIVSITYKTLTFRSFNNTEKPNEIDINSFIGKILNYFNLTFFKLQKSKKSEIVRIRFSIIYILRDYGFTFKNISKVFNQDHSTIMNAVKVVNDTFDSYPELRETFMTINTIFDEHMKNQKKDVA